MKIALILLFVCAAYAQTSNFFKSASHSFGKGASKFKSSSVSKPSFQSQPQRQSSLQFQPKRKPSFQSQPRKQSSFRQPKPQILFPSQSTNGGDSKVDNSQGGSEYHYSWRHVGKHKKWNWNGASNYCTGLGLDWKLISINSKSENSLVTSALSSDGIPYIWTGGRRSGSTDWKWPKGDFRFTDWSHTGGFQKSQPDNRIGDENCLAVLNNVYKDGIKWHDVGCGHVKPVICERS